ncbi:uncharacterized protein LOC126234765 [Schistocerca nitens]|uniref:uncharacterized protein LOC126234765 n=1 Tax=Schistocerca nitens TaxID=7011 RepID=UPI0021189306|nr:uncharacterized protein LOC126234765 [Schistocerca nitens]
MNEVNDTAVLPCFPSAGCDVTQLRPIKAAEDRCYGIRSSSQTVREAVYNKMKAYLLVILLIGAAACMAGAATTGCSCPQCIIFDPICASSYKNGRRGFSSGCHMRCYNRCYGTDYYQISKGIKCI